MPEQLATIEKVFMLQSIDLFADAAAESLLGFAKIAKEQEYKQGDVVFSEGEAADSFFILARGSILLESKTYKKSEEVAEHREFGVLAALSSGMRHHTATCNEDCLVLRINSEDFFDHLTDDEEIVRAVIRYLAGQIRLT